MNLKALLCCSKSDAVVTPARTGAPQHGQAPQRGQFYDLHVTDVNGDERSFNYPSAAARKGAIQKALEDKRFIATHSYVSADGHDVICVRATRVLLRTKEHDGTTTLLEFNNFKERDKFIKEQNAENDYVVSAKPLEQVNKPQSIKTADASAKTTQASTLAPLEIAKTTAAAASTVVENAVDPQKLDPAKLPPELVEMVSTHKELTAAVEKRLARQKNAIYTQSVAPRKQAKQFHRNVEALVRANAQKPSSVTPRRAPPPVPANVLPATPLAPRRAPPPVPVNVLPATPLAPPPPPVFVPPPPPVFVPPTPPASLATPTPPAAPAITTVKPIEVPAARPFGVDDLIAAKAKIAARKALKEAGVAVAEPVKKEIPKQDVLDLNAALLAKFAQVKANAKADSEWN